MPFKPFSVTFYMRLLDRELSTSEPGSAGQEILTIFRIAVRRPMVFLVDQNCPTSSSFVPRLW